MTQPLVRASKVTKKFLHEGREVVILRGIDLAIDRGEMLTIVGASGAGKSTLLHILGTLDLPTSGDILYEGQNVTRLPGARLADFRNRSLGFVFQFHHLLPEFTAIENVMMPGLIRGIARAAMHAKAKALLDEVGLAHRLSHRPGELSGGEQQRVALARALVMAPKLVLADEPTGNLDSKTSEQMHQLFFELNRNRGVTFLIVTHSKDLAALMPRVVTMRDGQIETDERRSKGGAAPPRRRPALRPDVVVTDVKTLHYVDARGLAPEAIAGPEPSRTARGVIEGEPERSRQIWVLPDDVIPWLRERDAEEVDAFFDRLRSTARSGIDTSVYVEGGASLEGALREAALRARVEPITELPPLPEGVHPGRDAQWVLDEAHRALDQMTADEVARVLERHLPLGRTDRP